MGLFHSKISHYFFTARNLFFKQKTAKTAHLIVEVEHGRLRGKESKAVYSRKKYCSFLGVPFAKPPLDDLRFRPPEPHDPWEGVYDATYERGECIQKDPFLFVIIGTEDCLYLNIFTPKPPGMITHPLPVMVFIHGGGFYFGSGSRKMYAADFLINQDIILVTMNYRLHVLGFLNLGIEECPGNIGMKDQTFALQWVQRNIRNFGGDQNNVTIFGESAGSAAVQYHMISPLSQGLFHKAILQSGIALAAYGFTPNPIEVAFSFGRKAGFRGTDRHKLVEFLKKLSAGDLTRISEEVLEDQQDDTPAKVVSVSPSIETIAVGAFLPDHPSKLIKLTKPLPTIWGQNNLEALALFKIIRSNIMSRIGKDFSILLKSNFRLDQDVLPIVAEEIHQLYFGDKEVALSTGRELVDLMTDLLFYQFYDCMEPLLKSQISPYVYKFTYTGRLNFVNKYIQLTNAHIALLSDFNGAAHGDELFYLFYVKLLLLYPPTSKNDKKIIKTMTTMWANFATTGNPSTEDIEWKPAKSKDLCYLEINVDPQMKKGKIAGQRFEKLHEILDPVAEPSWSTGFNSYRQ